MKVFVTGVNGQLGYDVMLALTKERIEAICSGSSSEYSGIMRDIENMPYAQLDITDSDAVERVITETHPDAVVHCAAWTDVDGAEDPENKDKVYAINVTGTENIAKACKKVDAKMIYISTDYVFNGQGEKPWTVDDVPDPLNYYGETKLAGETAVKQILEKYYIVRTSWVFGANGKNFVKTMLKLAETHDEIRVVNDQFGLPTYTPDLAELLVEMVKSDKYGTYHATNSGDYISWYDFAKEIFKVAGKDVKVMPITTAEYGMTKAKRPCNSRLETVQISDLGFTNLPFWKDSLSRLLIH